MKKEDMMHTRGLVIKKEKNGFAQVVMDRKNACSGCDTGKVDKCRACLTGTKIKARVHNSKGAEEGDIVTVSMSRAKIMKGAAAFYLIPVIFLIAGAFVGASLGFFLTIDNNLAAMIGGFVSLVFGFYIVRKISERMNSDQGLVPEITEIVSSGSINTPVKRDLFHP